MLKKTIYIADLMNNDYGLAYSTTPLGIGVIGSYILHKFGTKNIEIRLFRIFSDLDATIKEKKPDILALSDYAWNENLTAAAFQYFRKICPNAVFVTGGSNISVFGWEKDYLPKEKDKMCTRFSKKLDAETFKIMPEVDFLVHGYGEYPFANIVEKILAAKTNHSIKGNRINGCTGFYDGEFFIGDPVPLISDLDEFPSPYTNGLFNEMMTKYHLPTQIETNRGCPYQCGFCAIGGAYNQIVKHSFDYIKDEILYAKDNVQNRFLRIADSNFGVIEQDLKIAEFIHSLQKKTGYPVAVRMYYSTRRANDRTKKIATMMKDYLPFNISLQTNTQLVLKNLNRANPSEDDIREMVNFANDNGLSASTELITGMPGETYESFKDTCDTVAKYGFDSIYVNSLYLLKGSDLYTDEVRKKYDMKTMFAVMTGSITKIDGKYCFEQEEYPVETNYMTAEDFWKLYKLRIFMFMIYGAGHFKELIMHLYTYNISFIDIYDELITGGGDYVYFNSALDDAVNSSQEDKLFPTTESLIKRINEAVAKENWVEEEEELIEGFGLLYKIVYIVGNMLSRKNKRYFIDEFKQAACTLYERSNKDGAEFHQITDEIANLTYDIIISPLEDYEEVLDRESYYDLVKWAGENYRKKLKEYRLDSPKSFGLSIRNVNEHEYLVSKSKDMNSKEKLKLYFGQLNSSNMRRWLSGHDG